MKNIAKMIADLRKDKGWSQTELATESGVSREIMPLGFHWTTWPGKGL